MSQDTFNVVQSDTFANECIIAKKYMVDVNNKIA